MDLHRLQLNSLPADVHEKKIAGLVIPLLLNVKKKAVSAAVGIHVLIHPMQRLRVGRYWLADAGELKV